MTRAERMKRSAELVWWIKGHLWPCLATMSDDELDSLFNSYTKRLWWNTEAGAYRDEEGFEKAWLKFKAEHNV